MGDPRQPNRGKKDPARDELIPKHGGFRSLKSFQVAQLVYDLTVRFCDRYIDLRSRTHDQMVQAARSGVQNIAEGSQASGTSRKFELKLTNVARASLEELRLDYEDFLRQRGLPEWEQQDARRQGLIDRRPKTADEVADWAREVKGKSGPSGQSGQSGRIGRGGATRTKSRNRTTAEAGAAKDRAGAQNDGATDAPADKSTMSTPSTPDHAATYPEIAANGALALINVATFLLDRQLKSLAEGFVEEGGFTERLYRTRRARRDGP